MSEEASVFSQEITGKSAVTERGELIEERGGKNYYHSEKPDLIIQEFTEAGRISLKKTKHSLSAMRNEISSYLFEYVEGYHIATHFVSKMTSTAMVVKRLKLLPLTLRIYNVAGGGLSARFSLKEGAPLEFPVIEHYYTAAPKAPELVNEHHLFAFNVVTPEEFKQINRIASKANAVLRGLCDRRHLVVADLQLAFGRFKDQLLLADELSPFTCHFLDVANKGKRGQDRFLPDQENATEAFTELHHRLRVKV